MREGWEIKKLGEVCEIIKRGVSPKYTSDANSLIVINQKCIRNHDVNLSLARNHNEEIKSVNPERLVQYGDVLVNSTGTGTLGRVAQIRDEKFPRCTVDTHVTIVRPIKNLFELDFFGYIMISIENVIKEAGEGTSGQTELKRTKLSDEFYISFPKSLPEQKQIVALLDQAFTAIDQAKANIEKNIANAKKLLDSYMQTTFKPNVEGGNSSPLNSICELIVDCEHKTAPKQETGYPSIRTPNIGFGELILNNVNRVSEEVYTKWTRRAIPMPGDLILAREAPAGNIGVIPKDTYVCLGQRTVLIRPQKDKFISKYLAYLILSKDVQKRLLSHSQGATVGHINMRDIRAFKIFNLPSLDNQKKIVNKIDRIIEKTKLSETLYKTKLHNLEELKKSLLQKAFAGELTAKEVTA